MCQGDCGSGYRYKCGEQGFKCVYCMELAQTNIAENENRNPIVRFGIRNRHILVRHD